MKKLLFFTLVGVVIATGLMFSFSPAVQSDSGMTKISGIAYFPEGDECSEPPEGPDEALDVLGFNMTGSLNGCLYSYVLSFEERPGGIYQEKGVNIYVGGGGEGDDGTFSASYRFIAKFDEEGNELWGRCFHPITEGSGTGDYEGVTGRFNIRDNVDADPMELHYKGHLRIP